MGSPLRIAHVVCTDAFAGVERYVTTLAAGLAGAGCEVTVIGGQAARMTAALEPAGVRWLSGPRLVDAIRLLAPRRDLDIVHVHMTAAEIAGLVTRPLTGVPVVATRHFAQWRGSTLPARLLGRLITPRLAAQLAISNFVAGATEGPSIVIPPGSPAADGDDIPRADQRQPVVLVAQRLEPEKRTDLAVEAWYHSGLADRGWRLDIAGDGQERPRLERLAARLGIAGSCHFLGARADVDALQRTASILLAPRPDEPFGLSVIEAMAAGLPVVAAAGGGHLETVGRIADAALYPPYDTAAAGRLLAQLADDPERRSAYGSALRREHRENFSLQRQVTATLEVYRSLV